MRPAVTEVEFVDELFTGYEPAKGYPMSVQQILGVLVPARSAHMATISHVELMQVRAIPACECIIDRLGQLPERVTSRRREQLTRPGRGHKSSPLPPIRSTRIYNQVLAAHRS